MGDFNARPLKHPPKARLSLPGSALAGTVATVAAALADGMSTLRRTRLERGTDAIIDLLRRLGVLIESDPIGGTLRIHGRRGHLPEQEGSFESLPTPLAAHLAIAICSLGFGPFRIEGGTAEERFHVGLIVDALRDLGARIGYENDVGRLPVTMQSAGLRGGRITVAELSLEALASLLVVAPYASHDVLIEITGTPAPAELATVCEVVDAFGVTLIEQKRTQFIVAAPQRYQGREYAVPPDPAEAAALWAVAAITGGYVAIELGPDPRPSMIDRVLTAYRRFGALTKESADAVAVAGPPQGERLRGAEIDLAGHAGLAVPLALVAAFADGTTRFRGVSKGNVPVALPDNLRRLGARVDLEEDVLTVDPPKAPHWGPLDAQGEPLLAAALTVVAPAAPEPITVLNVGNLDPEWAVVIKHLEASESI